LSVTAPDYSSVTPSVMYPYGAAVNDIDFLSLGLDCSQPGRGSFVNAPLAFRFYGGMLTSVINVSNMTCVLTYCNIPVDIYTKLAF
jgi:hypothetical protein